MKKCVCLLFALICSVMIFTGCSSGDSNLTEEQQTIVRSAVETTDEYLDAKISASKAESTLDELCKKFEATEDETNEDSLTASTDILLLSTNFAKSTVEKDKITEYRNKLAQIVGMTKR